LPPAALTPTPLFRLHHPRLGFMLVLFDHSTPAPLTSYLIGHTVTEARDRRWDRLSNGDLLTEAERAGFDVLLTVDKNIRYQQNLTNRKIAIVVLSTPQWPVVRLHIDKIAAAVNAAAPGSYAEVNIPVAI
jgi:hypothetical protein